MVPGAVELGMAAINEEGYGGPVGDMGSTNNVDTLKNIWFDDTEAWEGIDEVIFPHLCSLPLDGMSAFFLDMCVHISCIMSGRTSALRPACQENNDVPVADPAHRGRSLGGPERARW